MSLLLWLCRVSVHHFYNSISLTRTFLAITVNINQGQHLQVLHSSHTTSLYRITVHCKLKQFTSAFCVVIILLSYKHNSWQKKQHRLDQPKSCLQWIPVFSGWQTALPPPCDLAHASQHGAIQCQKLMWAWDCFLLCQLLLTPSTSTNIKQSQHLHFNEHINSTTCVIASVYFADFSYFC